MVKKTIRKKNSFGPSSEKKSFKRVSEQNSNVVTFHEWWRIPVNCQYQFARGGSPKKIKIRSRKSAPCPQMINGWPLRPKLINVNNTCTGGSTRGAQSTLFFIPISSETKLGVFELPQLLLKTLDIIFEIGSLELQDTLFIPFWSWAGLPLGPNK